MISFSISVFLAGPKRRYFVYVLLPSFSFDIIIIIRGYYKNDEETEAAGLKDESGWLRSGDIGMWTLNGQLSLIDRKKNLFKLSQGEYIAVEKVEGILGQSSLISQIFVYGDSAEDKLVAVVALDEDAVKAWRLEGEGSKGGGDDSDSLKAAVLTQMKDTGRGLGLKGFELVYSVTVEKMAWTPENGLLTPTMKLKREALKGLYQSQIKAMYLQLKKEGSPNSRL
jgi:long-chain acyl-CoA synthetase